MITPADIRSYAMSLPDVVEKPHFRLPAFRVADKLFVQVEKGDTHAVVCVGQAEAERTTAGNPDIFSPVWRNGTFFVGLRVDLTGVTPAQMRELIELAWRSRAPKRLVTEYDRRPAGDSFLGS